MLRLPLRAACGLALFLPVVLCAQLRQMPPRWQNPSETRAIRSRTHAQSFLLARIVRNGSAASMRLRGMRQAASVPLLQPASNPWQPAGPSSITSSAFGAVSGRVTALAIAPWDASGNTIYVGSTGGGVWKSTNAAASDPTTVTWQPLTDDPSAFTGINITSLSIGALGVQPGNAVNGVVLAGTGDPNDVLDSYYGAGILRSADGGATWTLVTQSSDAFAGGLANYSFVGDAFSGFAWSTANPQLVVAAVTDSYDGFVNDINNSGNINVAEAGLYYSTDSGQTWYLSTIEDGPNQVIQSAQTTIPSVFPGVPVSAVVWNPQRQMFFAAVQYHGYYQSADGVMWTRMTNQPGPALSAANCPSNPGTLGSNSCALFRGALAVQPATGDMFALTVDNNGADEGLWRDVCNAGVNGCANPVVQFSVQIADTALDDGGTPGVIPQGTYNLALAAVANGADTLLFAGTGDIFRCSLSAGCAWRNTTNAGTCNSGKVAPAEHAITSAGIPPGASLPLLYFGNDGGLWRSSDGVAQSGPVCASSDAFHFEDLNGTLGSLAEVNGLADDPTDANRLLAGFGVLGTAATQDMGSSAWPQLTTGFGTQTAIDPANPATEYVTTAAGVSIAHCTLGANCTASDFAAPGITGAQTANDQSLAAPPYTLDAASSTNLILGTCRIWRGPAVGGGTWSAANAISPMLDGHPEPACNGNALVRSVASGGPGVTTAAGEQNIGSQVIYAGMAGLLDGGGSNVSGHVFATFSAGTANGTQAWTDLALSPAANEQSYGGIFNPQRFDVSALYADPHDATGKTVYAAVQGFGAPHLYQSSDGGADWTNITQNLPDLPLNDVMVDPNDASVVYAASDGGVFVAQNVAACLIDGGQCWNRMGTGLPLAPAVRLTATPADGGLLRVGTYGRGVWQIPLLSAAPQASVTLTPAALTFAAQAVQTASAAQTVTVQNTGSNALTIGSIVTAGDFSQSNNCGASLAAGSSCAIQVVFTPTAAGTRTGSLVLSGNIPNGQQSIPLSGTGSTPAPLTLLPGSVTFGPQAVSTSSAAQQVTISNSSPNPQTVGPESITGPFAIQTNTCGNTLAANSGCTLAIVFTPVQTGAAAGVLSVGGPAGTETVPLVGSGVNPATDVLQPLSLSFPQTLVGSASPAQRVTLTNSGGQPLSGIQIIASGDFTVSSQCGSSLNPQSSCVIAVQFTPHATGSASGVLTVMDALRTQSVALNGTAIAPPTGTLSASSIQFPPTVLGQTTAPQTITLTNSGDEPLTALSIQAAGAGFSANTTCAATVAPHSSCTIAVRFAPATVGLLGGQLVVADTLRTQTVSLSGEGEAPAEDNLSPLALNFGVQPLGAASAAQIVTLSNNGQASLTGIQIQTTNSDFAFTTTCTASLAPGAACVVRVAFSPRATGPDKGELVVTDVLRSQQILLTGSGTLPNIGLAPGALNFGPVGITLTSATQQLTLTNGSAAPMTGIAISASGAFTQANACGLALAPGSSCIIQVEFSPMATGAQQGTLTVAATNASTLTTALSGTGIAFNLTPASPTQVSVASGATATYSIMVTPVAGSVGTVSFACGSLPPDAACAIAPSTASLQGPALIQVSVATGVNAAAQGKRRSPGSPLRWAVLLLPFAVLRRRRGLYRLGLVLVLLAAGGGLTACGRGAGPLGASAPNPLPASPYTPPATYTLSVSGSSGGMTRSVALTLQVQ